MSLKGRKIILHDMCLRDGMHAKKEQISVEQMVAVARALDEAGVPMMQVTHGAGVGGNSLQHGFAPHSNEEYISAVAPVLKQAVVSVLLLPGLGTMRELHSAYDCGARSVHVATHCTEADTSPQHIAYARKLGMDTTGFLMMAHLNTPEGLVQQGKLMESYGAHTVYITDSAGYMLPEDVKRAVGTLRGVLKPETEIGFHGHNNMGMGIANSLAAIEEGASRIDASVAGLGAGAGNTPLEVFAAVCERMGIVPDPGLRRRLFDLPAALQAGGPALWRPGPGYSGGTGSKEDDRRPGGYDLRYGHDHGQGPGPAEGDQCMSNAKELAVVVGATGAFGTAIVQRLAGAGLRVLAVARNADSLAGLQQRVAGVEACAADIADDSAIEAIRAACDGPVRLVVHGPGVAVAGGILTAPTASMVDAVNIKVGGMLRLARAVDARLQRGSRLVAIGGHYGFEPTAYAAAAGVANSALVNVMRQLSLAYGERGVTAHLIAPGPADTERLHRVAGDRAKLRGVSVEAVLDEMKAESSIHAFTTPEQVAWAVALLLDPEADAMTGATLMLDSGRRRGLP